MDTDVAISLTKCNGEAGCASDGTGWKVTFSSTPTTAGRATITVKATNTSTGLIGYTSFTLQGDPTAGANPPSLATLPNYGVQQTYYDPTTHSYYANYTAQFAIGDLGSSGNYVNKEDVEVIYSNYTGDFIETWNNASLIDFITLTPVPLSSDPDIARRENHHSYILTAQTKPGATGTGTITVTLTDPDSNSTSTSYVLQVGLPANNVPPDNHLPSSPTQLTMEPFLLIPPRLRISSITSSRPTTTAVRTITV